MCLIQSRTIRHISEQNFYLIVMKNSLLSKFALFSLPLVLSASAAFAQETAKPEKKRNFGYSSNPVSKTKQVKTQETKPVGSESAKIVQIVPASLNVSAENSGNNQQAAETLVVNNQGAETANETIAKKTLEIAKKASVANLPPTEIYKIGAGDVLFITLQNAPANNSNYFTVLKDGSIDYPLGGGIISVLGMTTDDLEAALESKVTLYENPQVVVKVREANSHAFTVLGLVEKAGEKLLQREAIPLYVVRAEAIAQPAASRVVIKRMNSTTENYELKSSEYENVLVFPGDIVEFTGNAATASAVGEQAQFYYIGGVISGGQKTFHSGMTLTQAILASDGLKNQKSKNVTIRRKNEAGMLVPTNYDLKAIKDGKVADPVLEAGDTIEIGN